MSPVFVIFEKGGIESVFVVCSISENDCVNFGGVAVYSRFLFFERSLYL